MKVYFRILMNRTKLVDLLLKKRMSTISMKRNNTILYSSLISVVLAVIWHSCNKRIGICSLGFISSMEVFSSKHSFIF